MYVGMNEEITGLDYKFIKFSEKDFDTLMCTKFPEIFQDRRKPMSQTCMCWGFSVGPGWYPLLFKLCSQLQVIYRLTGIIVIADQVKEKFGGLRFYHHIDSLKLKIDNAEVEIWISVIDDLFSKAEEDSYRICGSCGKYMRHKQIRIGGWVYDQCRTCLTKNRSEMKKEIDKVFKERKDRKNTNQYIDVILENKKCSDEDFRHNLKVLFGIEYPEFDSGDEE